jgi:hypothetical protein
LEKSPVDVNLLIKMRERTVLKSSPKPAVDSRVNLEDAKGLKGFRDNNSIFQDTLFPDSDKIRKYFQNFFKKLPK